MPEPISVAAPKRRRWVAWVVVSVLLLVLAACIATVTLGAKLIQTVVDLGSRGLVTGGSFATFTADGTWVLCQSSGSAGVTRITAVRPSDGASETLEGYSLVAVEPAGSRIRVTKVPDTAPFSLAASGADETATLAALDGLTVGPGTYEDVPGLRTLSWDPASGAEPTTGPWADDSRDATHRASFRTGASGAYPNAMTFAVDGAEHTVASTTTMQPIGWSSSGRYYAAVGLRRPDTPESEGPRTVMLRVWDAEDGIEVASTTVEMSFLTRFVWAPASDTLYWSAFPTGADAHQAIWCLKPGGAVPATTVASVNPSSAAVLAGADDLAVLVRCWPSGETSSSAASRKIYPHVRIGRDGVVHVAGSDSIRAMYAEACSTGAIYWMPVFPPESDTSLAGALGASGIDVWHAASFDTTPTLLFHAGY